jgi:hypothetical protein
VAYSFHALKIINAMDAVRNCDFVFCGQKPGKPLSTMALEMVLRRMKTAGVTVHGFRSAFRDWAAECTTFPNEVCEAALAHVVRNKVEAAYRRGDLLNKRRELMEVWGESCSIGQHAYDCARTDASTRRPAHSPNVAPCAGPWEASSRARASVTSRAEPNPISVGLPCQRNRETHLRPPFGEIERYRPPPISVAAVLR